MEQLLQQSIGTVSQYMRCCSWSSFRWPPGLLPAMITQKGEPLQMMETAQVFLNPRIWSPHHERNPHLESQCSCSRHRGIRPIVLAHLNHF